MADAPPGVAGRLRSPRGYAVTVLVGLAGAGLAAFGGTRQWASGHAFAAGIRVEASAGGADAAPLVGALGLVALAAWGVVLVTRGQLRRAVAVAGLLAALGSLAAAVLGASDAGHAVTAALLQKGATGRMSVSAVSAWCYLAAVGAAVAVLAFAVAVRHAPSWPAMGSRYDAPAGRAGARESEPDMWRSLDHGEDPTS
ncbi:MAG TPA: Trp biosynthesis-associated membrane protein [Nocardioidaceae bacterium]|jgi:uncharacterized membrane protein (TIGR02234 family)